MQQQSSVCDTHQLHNFDLLASLNANCANLNNKFKTITNGLNNTNNNSKKIVKQNESVISARAIGGSRVVVLKRPTASKTTARFSKISTTVSASVSVSTNAKRIVNGCRRVCGSRRCANITSVTYEQCGGIL